MKPPCVRSMLLVGVLTLAACTNGPTIDATYISRNQDSRVLFLVLHYTVDDFETSLRNLTTGRVSSHYLISDGRNGDPVRIYQLVDDSRRAWHAGLSEWMGHSQLNSSSIGIELVNRGRIETQLGENFELYPEEQIDALVLLVKDIARRHQIRPDRILGHSDIQPRSKQDPGPLFPWKRLADEGLISWPDEKRVVHYRSEFDAAIPPVAWFQERLAMHGFGSSVPRNGDLDEATCDVLSAFQMKYRPTHHDGTPDAETAALLAALTEDLP